MRTSLIGLLLLAAGCAQPGPRRMDFSEARRNLRPSDYPQVRSNWTRHEQVLEDVGTVIEVWATCKSWEFRQAHLEAYAEIYSLPESERAALYEAQREAARKSYEFHLVVQTTNYKWNDLEQKTSPWRVTLVDGAGSELQPASIEALKLPEAYEAKLFPYRTPFSRTYAIRFDRAGELGAGFAGPAGGRIQLRLASPLARVTLVWRSK